MFLRRLVTNQEECAVHHGATPLRETPTRNRIMESLESRILFSLNPTGLEQEMLELINRLRMNPANELNEIFISTDPSHPSYFRSEDADVNAALDFFGVDAATLFSQWGSLTSAPPLAWNEALYDAARNHSVRMGQQDLQSHQLPADAGLGLPAEASLLNRAVAAGYNWTGSVSVGENVFAYAESVFHGHVAFAIDWGNTPTGIQTPPGHRENLMDTTYTEIGIGIIQDNNSATTVGPLLVTQDFGHRGNYGNARLLGVVFSDGDGDQFYDAGEGIGNVTLTITNGTSTFTTTTMSAGGYQIELAPGTYSVSASGGSLSGPTFMGSVTVGAQNVKLDLNSATVPTTGGITGLVYNDANQNGTQGAGENGLAGWTVFLDADNDGQLDAGERSALTNATGTYSFTDLTPGSWTVRVTGQATYRGTSPASLAQTVTVSAGALTSGTNFGQFQWIVQSGSDLTIHGTSQNDTLIWNATTANSFTLNGTNYSVQGTVSQVTFWAASGSDTIHLAGNAGDDTLTANYGNVQLSGTGYLFVARDGETVHATGGAGYDTAFFTDSVGNDTFTANPNEARMDGSQGLFMHRAIGFEKAIGYSNLGGVDVAFLCDGATNDRLTAHPTYAILQALDNSFHRQANAFEQVYSYASTGMDEAYLYDSAGNDEFSGQETLSFLRATNGAYYNVARYFDRVYATATTGYDLGFLYDSAANDTFTANPSYGQLTNGALSYLNRGTGFDRLYAYANNGGADTALLSDSSGDDILLGRADFSALYGVNTSYYNQAKSFERVYSTASTGYDEANLVDGSTNDTFIGTPTVGTLRGNAYEFFNQATGFDKVRAYAYLGGSDEAFLYDAASNDQYVGRPDFGLLQGPGSQFYLLTRLFERNFAYATAGGQDTAFLYDSAGDEQFVATPLYAEIRALNDSYMHRGNNFDRVYGYAESGGTDSALLYDGATDDMFIGGTSISYLQGQNLQFYNQVKGFDTVNAYATGGGNDTAFLYDSAGDDSFYGRANYGILSGLGFYNRVVDFDTVRAYATAGGNDTVDIDSLDYAFSQIGIWI